MTSRRAGNSREHRRRWPPPLAVRNRRSARRAQLPNGVPRTRSETDRRGYHLPPGIKARLAPYCSANGRIIGHGSSLGVRFIHASSTSRACRPARSARFASPAVARSEPTGQGDASPRSPLTPSLSRSGATGLVGRTSRAVAYTGLHGVRSLASGAGNGEIVAWTVPALATYRSGRLVWLVDLHEPKVGAPASAVLVADC